MFIYLFLIFIYAFVIFFYTFTKNDLILKIPIINLLDLMSSYQKYFLTNSDLATTKDNTYGLRPALKLS